MRVAIIVEGRGRWPENDWSVPVYEDDAHTVFVIPVGASIMGYGFDRIIADPSCIKVPFHATKMARDWWDSAVRCRVEPGGVIDPNPWEWAP